MASQPSGFLFRPPLPRTVSQQVFPLKGALFEEGLSVVRDFIFAYPRTQSQSDIDAAMSIGHSHCFTKTNASLYGVRSAINWNDKIKNGPLKKSLALNPNPPTVKLNQFLGQ
jgi:hypothetical protein